MRKIGVAFILAFIILSLVFVHADGILNPSPTDDNSAGSDVAAIQNVTDQIPIDPNTGGLDPTKISGWKSKAELRIDAINAWLVKTDPYFNWLFGIPLRLSWQFIYLFFLVLISLSVFHNLPNWLKQDNEVLDIVLSVVVTFALGYFRAFLWIVTEIITVTNLWWWNYAVVGVLIILLFLVAYLAQVAKKRKEAAKKHQEEQDREKLHSDVKVADTLTDAIDKD
jgi:hypothetical protein